MDKETLTVIYTILYVYCCIGFWWALCCLGVTMKRNYPKKYFSWVVGFIINGVIWPVSMIWAYKVERERKKK